MPMADEILAEALAPLRELHLSDLLERMRRAAVDGASVTPEPWRRDPAGGLLREGRLRLPSRHDFEADCVGRVLHPRVETPLEHEFAPFAARAPQGFTIDIRPFRWEAAELSLVLTHSRPSWAPLRSWFLEFSQAGRDGPDGPELLGVLHALGDPRPAPGGAAIRIDFGSAPMAALPALIGALAETGASQGRLADADL